ncbi:hypothetical protein N0V95_009777 [Ascochyta clinopodiicola]|nr:hypothetical protein N0V95_009777 [Ascochyta clinopodiicola]
MRPAKSISEPKRLPPVAKPLERFGRTEGPKVLLLVGHDGLPGGSCRFLVSQSCLQALGPRWQQLLSSRSKPRIRNPLSTLPKTISLRDEHTNAMRLIMHIAHLQFTKLPKQLDFQDIVHLADIAARFDAHGLVVSHIDAWLAPYRDRLLHPGYEEWLFIAYEFGYETEYLELAKHLAIRCRVDPSGNCLLVPGIGGLLEGKFPVDTLVHVNEARRQILADMLRATYLRGLELFPVLKDTTTYQPSPYELSTILSNARHLIPIGMTVSLATRAVQVLEQVAWPVEIPTLLRIKRNAERLGKQSERHDAAKDFLAPEFLLERRFKVVRKIEAALDTDPNVLSVR